MTQPGMLSSRRQVVFHQNVKRWASCHRNSQTQRPTTDPCDRDRRRLADVWLHHGPSGHAEAWNFAVSSGLWSSSFSGHWLPAMFSWRSGKTQYLDTAPRRTEQGGSSSSLWIMRQQEEGGRALSRSTVAWQDSESHTPAACQLCSASVAPFTGNNARAILEKGARESESPHGVLVTWSLSGSTGC